jgi:putative tryptophan/tyrosine transport system substrate-binding protein
MRRREFLGTLAGAAAAPVMLWPLAALAQPERMRRIGVLVGLAEDDAFMQGRLALFRQSLDQLGWSEDRNIRFDTRFADSKADRFPILAKELVALRPDVILAQTTPVAAALQRESRTIPIVFVNVADPVGSDLVKSLARPGGNLTGLLTYEAGIVSKWLSMLKEIAPPVATAGLLA